MKYSIKKTVLPIAIAAAMAGCTKDFEETNTDPFKPTSTSENFIFNSVLGSIPEGAYNTFLYLYMDTYTPVSQLMARIDQPDDPRRPVSTIGIGAAWGSYYGVLKNIRDIEKKLAEKSDQAAVANKLALLKIIYAYYSLRATDQYGDMPFTQAGLGFSGENQVIYAPYDAQDVIYKACLDNLKWAVDNLNLAGTGQESYGASETFLKNDYTKWAKLANALRLRYALRMVDKDAAYAKTVIQEVLASTLVPTAADNYLLYPYNDGDGLATDGMNWAMRESNRTRMGTNMYNLMKTPAGTIMDPRLKVFFSPAKGGQYVPLPNSYGARPANISVTANPYGANRGSDSSNFSPLNYGLVATGSKLPAFYIITYPEYKLLEAEAYARPEIGMVDNAKAKAAYDEGVKASVKFWYDVVANSDNWPNKPARPADADIDALVAAGGFYEFSAATAVKSIYAQRFIHYIRQPDQAWALFRQNSYSPREAVTGGSGLFETVRITYPVSESERNTENWRAEVDKLGGSDLTTIKVWWAK